MDAAPIQSLPGFQEPVSCWSHLIGAGLFAMLGIGLLRRGRGHRPALGVFVFSCVFLLSMSAVYHLLAEHNPGREVMRRLDHAAIFVLIAGTFTPAHAILFRGVMRWGMLGLIWAAAITGLTLKTVFFRDISEALGLTFYLGLGWIGLFSGLAIARKYGTRFVRPLVWGALAYTLGAILEFARWPHPLPGVIGPHELFHFAVLAGIGWHWSFVSQFAAGAPAADGQAPSSESDFS